MQLNQFIKKLSIKSKLLIGFPYHVTLFVDRFYLLNFFKNTNIYTMSKIPMTKEGYQKLFDDLRRMKGPEMQEVLQNLAEAREKGDVSENAEYDVAKEQFETLQKKISELSDRLANSVILDREMVKTNFVQILTTVRLENLKTKKEQTYTIVPENETDMKAGKISFSSPIGKGLIGKAVNEVVKIKVPAGELEFKILEITAR